MSRSRKTRVLVILKLLRKLWKAQPSHRLHVSCNISGRSELRPTTCIRPVTVSLWVQSKNAGAVWLTGVLSDGEPLYRIGRAAGSH